MRKRCRSVSKVIVAIVLAFALIAPIAMQPMDTQAAYGNWQHDGYGWRYFDYSEGYVTGLWRIDGTYYYFDTNSAYMQTGWIEFTDGYWRYFHPSGAMAIGWLNLGGTWYYLASSETGGMATGWWTIGGKDYYFADSGAMRTGWIYFTDDEWRYFEPGSGALVKGWKYIGGAWYYFSYAAEDDGAMLTGWWTISGKDYYFADSGAMQTGWIHFTDGYWRYFTPGSGAMATGWLQSGGSWYFLDPENDGAMIEDTWWNVNDKLYYFDKGGAMHTGWLSVDGIWYYYLSSGEEATGWQKIGGVWYYFEAEYYNSMATGLKKINGTYYYFLSSGAMATGWQKIEDSWYYFASNGAMVANQWVGNYYMLANGKMATNQWIGNYYVGADGVWIPGYSGPNTPSEPTIKTGWEEVERVWYYYDSYGYKVTGWQQINGNWYYFYTDGAMASDCWIGGDSYVGPDGIWIPNYVDTDENLDLLKTYILNNGFINNDGNKVINYVEDYEGTSYIGGIVYNYNTEELTFTMASEDSTMLAVLTMSVSGSIKDKNMYPEFTVVLTDDVTFGQATATINASTYYEEQEVLFTVTSANGLSDSQINEGANIFLQLGFLTWDMLLDDAGLSLNDIGFTAY